MNERTRHLLFGPSFGERRVSEYVAEDRVQHDLQIAATKVPDKNMADRLVGLGIVLERIECIDTPGDLDKYLGPQPFYLPVLVEAGTVAYAADLHNKWRGEGFIQELARSRFVNGADPKTAFDEAEAFAAECNRRIGAMKADAGG